MRGAPLRDLAPRDIVALNAGAAIYVSGKAASFGRREVPQHQVLDGAVMEAQAGPVFFEGALLDNVGGRSLRDQRAPQPQPGAQPQPGGQPQPPAYGQQPGYGQQPPPYGQPAYGQQQWGPVAPTNTLAILALVFASIFSPAAIVLGTALAGSSPASSPPLNCENPSTRMR